MVRIGIDLGGTNIAAGVVTDEGKLLYKIETPTFAERPWQPVVEDMIALSKRALTEAGCTVDDLRSIGVGVPGTAINGVVVFCTNLGWHDVPLERAFRAAIDRPLYIDNDANVAGLAEAVSGVSAGVPNSVFLTLGTGLGGGVIINKKIYTGSHGVGGELGHLTFIAGGEMCTCGKRGCLERYASATGMTRLASEVIRTHPYSGLAQAANNDPANLTGKLIVDQAKAGDLAAMMVFDQYVHYLAQGINTIISFIDPDMVVLGGGVSRAGAFLLDAVRLALPSYIFFKTLPHASIELAVLGNDAGIIGAAMLGAE
ncbi:MAG: ROK family protein [Oscillospiraceae bacterium]|jgi:glucokinase|nr:ROK family protein [Oscillospiraceae bacterium]